MHKVGWAALYTEDASAVLREGVVRTFWPSLKASFLSFRGCVLICVAEHFSVFFVRTLCSLCRKTNLNTKTTKQNQQRPQRKQEPLPLSVLFEILANSALKSFQTRRRKTHSPRKTHCQLNFLLVICDGLMLNYVLCSLHFALFSQTFYKPFQMAATTSTEISSMMNRERFSNLIKAGVIVMGAACFGFAAR